jgi:hypothetical protein
MLIRAAKRNISNRKIKIAIGMNNVRSESKLCRKQLK